MSRRFALLDRDGTINEEIGYVLSPDELRLIPGSAEAVRDLRALGLGVVVLTNQSPIGRGMLSEETLGSIHDRLRALLRTEGAEVDRIEHCPHAPADGCDCRKPEPGMALRAAAALGFDLASCFVVGDHAADMELGRRIGARTILVRTGHGEEELGAGAGALADHVTDDLRAAATLIGAELLDGAPR